MLLLSGILEDAEGRLFGEMRMEYGALHKLTALTRKEKLSNLRILWQVCSGYITYNSLLSAKNDVLVPLVRKMSPPVFHALLYPNHAT